MKKIAHIFSAPLIVKVLFFIYVYTMGKYAYNYFNPNLMSSMSSNFILILILATVFGLVTILWRMRWAWKYGIALNVFYFIGVIYTVLSPPANIYEIAAKEYQTKALSPMNQEQLELALNLAKYVTVATMFLTTAVFIFLWYKSKNYFQDN